MSLRLSPFKFRPTLATRDISAFKILAKRADNSLISLHYGYEYTQGQMEVGELARCGRYICDGFHSFTFMSAALDEMEQIKFFGPGVDMDMSKLAIYNAIIPAGSLYYRGNYRTEHRSIASNQIRITTQLCAFN